VDNTRTRTELTKWLAEQLPGTSLNVLATLADSGVSVVNRLVRQELRETADVVKDPAAKFDIHSRADRLRPRASQE
jgi:hypothetical protein